ncbi:MAG: hypothetical protein J6A77_10005 [Lachnospiraceae bacterium]|nr:hypothetical protein [Lachnospiraceae bacterium]
MERKTHAIRCYNGDDVDKDESNGRTEAGKSLLKEYKTFYIDLIVPQRVVKGKEKCSGKMTENVCEIL